MLTPSEAHKLLGWVLVLTLCCGGILLAGHAVTTTARNLAVTIDQLAAPEGGP